MYSRKHSKILYIAKLDQRFLANVDGEVDKILMTCLKPKIGLGTILEDTPKHLPPDHKMFNPWDIIFGPMEAVPLGSNKFNISKYEEARTVFEAAKNIDCRKLKTLKKQNRFFC